MPLIKKCKRCGTAFQTKAFFVNRGQGIYCSNKCRYLSAQKGKMFKCFVCKKEIYKTLKAIKRSQSGKFFCSKSCQTIWRNKEFSGPKHANYKDGQYMYRNILIKTEIPKECKLCGINDLRTLAVHHIDENRKNNKVENLIWLCHNCHHLVHRYKDTKAKLMEILV